MTELATMEFHPRPQAGEAKPWAFPAPERGSLDNGLTVLRCHRPGQQVVAVEVILDAPLDAEPEGLDGVATIMARAFSEGTDKHSAEEFAAELERCGATLDAHADHPGVRLSLEVPASRLAKGLGLVADALRAPAFADSEIERLVRNRLDEIPHELANPSRRAAKELSKELFPASARMSRPRQGTEETVERIDSAAVRGFYEKHVRPATATAVVVGDLTGVDLDALLADTLGAWTGSQAQPRPVPPVVADDTGRVVIVDRPGAVQTQLLIGRTGPDRHDRVWPAQVLGTYCLGGTLTSRLDRVLREEKDTPTAYGRSVRCCARPLTARARRCWPSAARSTPPTRARRWTTCGPCCARWPPRASRTTSGMSPCRTWWAWRRSSTRRPRPSRAPWPTRSSSTCRTTTRPTCTGSWPRPARWRPRRPS